MFRRAPPSGAPDFLIDGDRAMQLIQAVPTDAPDVLALYRACAKKGTSCWDDTYPNAGIVAGDIREGTLYVWREGGALLAAATLLRWDDIEDMPLGFQFTVVPCVLCRLCLSPGRQGRGEGRLLLRAAESLARALGYRAVHLLCDARNVIAHGLYTGAGYRYVCNAPLYGHEYEVFEKPLREP